MKIGVESTQAAAKETQLKKQLKTAGFWQCFVSHLALSHAVAEILKFYRLHVHRVGSWDRYRLGRDSDLEMAIR